MPHTAVFYVDQVSSTVLEDTHGTHWAILQTTKNRNIHYEASSTMYILMHIDIYLLLGICCVFFFWAGELYLELFEIIALRKYQT